VVQSAKLWPVVLALVTLPVVGLAAAWLVTVLLMHLLRRAPAGRRQPRHAAAPAPVQRVRGLHGVNDAQKTMAVIALALASTRHLALFAAPLWVVLAAAIAIGGGTWAGGRWIIRTMSSRVIKTEPSTGSPPRAWQPA
jgi:PiT family inorganic phosphate transporter